MTLNMPTVTLRCALTTSPLGTTVSYTDLSPRLLGGWTTDRGRADELVEFNTGAATFPLKDDDRVLDPANSSGTYYGKLTPRRKWNLQAAYGGTTYDVWTGFNRNWKPEWNSKHARHGIQCQDAFGMFANDSISGTVAMLGAGTLTGVLADRIAEPTTSRVGWIADTFGWPSAWRTFDAGVVTGQPHTYTAQNTLEAMRDMEKAEGGFLYMGTTGNLVFKNKYARAGGSLQAIFGDDQSGGVVSVQYGVRLTATNSGGSNTATRGTYVTATHTSTAAELPYTEWDYEPQDIDHLMNHVTGRIANQAVDDPSQYEYTDSSSVGTYGPAGYTFELLTNSDAEVEARTQAYVGRYATPAVRVKSITIAPRANPAAMWPKALGLAIGDRIRVKQRFYGTGATLSHDAFIEGVRHDVQPDDWRTTFSLSPVVSGYDSGSYFVLDSSGMDSSATVLGW